MFSSKLNYINFNNMSKESRALQHKYQFTSLVYDILDYPWELQYRKWRPQILKKVCGNVLEAGVGTGKNLPYYSAEATLTGIDLSASMLKQAKKRVEKAACAVTLWQADATDLSIFSPNYFDWFISTFMFCVIPEHLQTKVIEQMVRVLKPGGKFRIMEMVYSKKFKLLWKQKLFAPIIKWLYGASFDRQTLKYLQQNKNLKVQSTKFLKADTYLLIEGCKVS